MVLVIGILVEMQLNDVSQLQRLPRDRMLLELLDVGHNVCNVIHCAISGASLHFIHGTYKLIDHASRMNENGVSHSANCQMSGTVSRTMQKRAN